MSFVLLSLKSYKSTAVKALNLDLLQIYISLPLCRLFEVDYSF